MDDALITDRRMLNRACYSDISFESNNENVESEANDQEYAIKNLFLLYLLFPIKPYSNIKILVFKIKISYNIKIYYGIQKVL